jgi:parvulin-like peptidyl-prolyl isomerase
VVNASSGVFKLTGLSGIDRLEAMKTIVIFLAAAIGGLVLTDGQALAGSPRPAAPAPATALAAGPEVMATVNGQPILMNDMYDLLLQNYGLGVAQQLIANELVRQECERRKIVVTDKDVQHQHEEALRVNFPTLEPKQREDALKKYLESPRPNGQKLNLKQWNFTMRRLAQLAKLAEPRIKITDDELLHAFNDNYGRKVVVRHIELASLAEAQEVLAKLEKGADFLQLVREKSRNVATAANGGLLMPISRATTGFPPAIKDAALSMTKVGQISPVVQAGEVFHVLKVDQIIAPQDVRFEDVKEKLRQQVHDVRLQSTQQEILMGLIAEAKKKGSVQFTNPTMKQVWQEAEKEDAAGE